MFNIITLLICLSCVIVLIFICGSLTEALERFDSALVDFEMALASHGISLGGLEDETN